MKAFPSFPNKWAKVKTGQDFLSRKSYNPMMRVLQNCLTNLNISFQIGNLNIGSCRYDIQHLLEVLKGAAGGEEICQGLMAEGQDCNLPFMPGQYAAGTDVIEILLPEIPAVLQPFLKGTINAQVTGKKADGTPVACLEVNLELEQINIKTLRFKSIIRLVLG